MLFAASNELTVECRWHGVGVPARKATTFASPALRTRQVLINLQLNQFRWGVLSNVSICRYHRGGHRFLTLPWKVDQLAYHFHFRATLTNALRSKVYYFWCCVRAAPFHLYPLPQCSTTRETFLHRTRFLQLPAIATVNSLSNCIALWIICDRRQTPSHCPTFWTIASSIMYVKTSWRFSQQSLIIVANLMWVISPRIVLMICASYLFVL